MTARSNVEPRSGPTSSGSSWQLRVGFVGASIVGCGLAIAGATWMLTPASNSELFGIEMSGDLVAYGRVKGAEDLLVAALIAVFLRRRDPRDLATVMALGLIVPIGDLVSVMSVGLDASYAVIHAIFIVTMAAIALALRRASDTASAEQ